MKTLTATYRIVTPMFIGDAEQKATSIRPPSIKGALRFWWRACQWGKMLQETQGDVSRALHTLHQREAKLFGIAAEDNRGGQGRFLLQVNPTQLKEDKSLPKATEGIQYLLGQGIYDHKKGYLRNALKAEEKFDVSLCFRPNTSEVQEVKSIAEALLLFGLLGGLGSRARKGFGSIAIQKLNGYDGYSIPTNINEYDEMIKNLCHFMPADLPPFTAFSQESRIEVLQNQGQNAWQLLNDIGNEMKSYRSFQKDQLFSSDHDLARNVATGIQVSKHPDRVVFGLPHNYFFTSIQPARDAKVDVNPVHLKADSTNQWTSEGRGRRASPLFIHLHQFPNGHCVAIQALLPATFLPDSDRIEMKGSARHSATCQISPHIDWQIIRNYLDRFSSQKIYP